MAEEYLYVGGEEEMIAVYDAISSGLKGETTPADLRPIFDDIQVKLLRKVTTYMHGNDPAELALPLALLPQLRTYMVDQEPYFQAFREGDDPFRQRIGEAYDEILHQIGELIGDSE